MSITAIKFFKDQLGCFFFFFVPANEDEARLKRRYDDFWQGQYNAGYRPPRRTSQRLAMNNYNRKTIHDYEGQGLTPDEAFEVE